MEWIAYGSLSLGHTRREPSPGGRTLPTSKPAPAFFDACMAGLNEGRAEPILPGEVLMVGDSISSDMTGAMGYGMKTCYFNRFGKALPDGMVVDYEVSHLVELRESI